MPNIIDMIKQVELLEDYEQASQSLMDVVHVDPVTGGKLALNILKSNSADVYFRYFAFCMLYRANRSAAFEYITEHSSTCDSEVFGSMLCEISEDSGLYSDSCEIQKAVSQLKLALLQRSDIDIKSIGKNLHDFLEAYGDKSPPAQL
jgi:hypothetical protein